ncbi:MAG: hypothetical protein CMA12_08615 [Euryarchaeota archaeon]|nr:hypothetical protein [Euryarchaeota archaeon]
MKKIFLTGSTGFIGSNINSYLICKGYKVTCVSRKKNNDKNFIQLDLTKKIKFKPKKKFDCIIHCASISPNDKKNYTFKDYFLNNVISTKNIIDFAINNKIKNILYLSSISVLGNINDRIISNKTDIINPNYYGITKLIAENLLIDNEKFNSLAIRLPGVLGKNSVRNWLTKTLNDLKNNKNISIYNPNSKFNNCIHVSDLYQLIISFLINNTKIKDTITIGSKKQMRIVDVINLMKINSLSKSKILIKKNSNRKSFVISNQYATKKYKYNPSKTEEIIFRFTKENL